MDNSISVNNDLFDILLEPLHDAIERDLSSYEILDQLAPKYEEMQRILDFLPEPFKAILLGNALSSAINSNNPLESMQKQLTDLRKNKTRVMMLNNLTAFYRTGEVITKDFLQLLSKQKEYSHLTKQIN